jgi:hypothetical protein
MFHQRIIEQLRQLVSRSADVMAFERWLLANYQRILDSGEEPAVMLANELNALLVEQGEDLLSGPELLGIFSDILKREESSVSLTMGPPASVRTAAARTVRKNLQIAGQITDVHLSLQAV